MIYLLTSERCFEKIGVGRFLRVTLVILVENANRELIDMPWCQIFQHDTGTGTLLGDTIALFVDTTIVDLVTY